jgi:hypothetical protein
MRAIKDSNPQRKKRRAERRAFVVVTFTVSPGAGPARQLSSIALMDRKTFRQFRHTCKPLTDKSYCLCYLALQK